MELEGEEDDDENEESDDDEDNYSDIMEDEEEENNETVDSSDEDDEIIDDEDVEDKEISTVSKAALKKDNKKSKKSKDAKRKRVSFSLGTDEEETKKRQKQIQEDAKKELPYTIEVPSEYGEFWELVEGRSPEEMSTLLDRLIATNHPQLQHSNVLKCSTLFSYLLQCIYGLCRPEGVSPHPQHNPLSYIDIMVPHLYNVSRLIPLEAGRAFLSVFIEKRDEYRDRVKKRYPMLDTLIFLQLAGIMFPGSDFYHPVMTPVKLLLTQLLGEAKMKQPRDVLASLFCSTLLLEVSFFIKQLLTPPFCPVMA